MQPERDHGGGLDAAIAQWGGTRETWLDLSTGIAPEPYPFSPPNPADWTALPDRAAWQGLIDAARHFWSVPEGFDILPAPGASALIARIPGLWPRGTVVISGPTYNEHAASFSAAGWQVRDAGPGDLFVHVHPNNPDGRLRQIEDLADGLHIIDESFADVDPDISLLPNADPERTIVLKSFGKFWGLAGVRLGFAIGPPPLIASLREMLGPWSVAGPALRIGAEALRDKAWAAQNRIRLQDAAARLDRLMGERGATLQGGTSLFRLYEVDDAQRWQDRMAAQHIWSRVFPYNPRWLRLGLPPETGWTRLESDW